MLNHSQLSKAFLRTLSMLSLNAEVNMGLQLSSLLENDKIISEIYQQSSQSWTKPLQPCASFSLMY